MWELIRLNRRKSLFLFLMMGGILILIGYFVGQVTLAENGGVTGAIIALGIWAVWSLVGYYKGDSILLALSGAKKVTHNIHPQLFNVVEEMKIAANLPSVPQIFIIDEESPNAFATGRKPEKSAIAVTAGLLNRLNRNELQGVIAHEMSHIMNRDVLFMTFAGIMLGSVVLISEVFLRGLWYSGGSSVRYRSRRSGKSNSAGALILIAVLLAILAPLLSRIFYFAISRKREYLADASAARLTRYPEGLASALDKISSAGIGFKRANRITAPMYIVNPLKSQGRALTGLFSTHPPIKKRISILRNIIGGVNYVNYQSAFKIVTGKEIIPRSGLKDSGNIAIKKPTEMKAKEADMKSKKRELGDLIRVLNGFIFLVCICGLKIKLPPGFKEKQLSCPRCKKMIPIPLAKIAAISAAVSPEVIKKGVTKKEPYIYKRKGGGWETFSCECGHLLQISPSFQAKEIQCQKCHKITKIQ